MSTEERDIVPAPSAEAKTLMQQMYESLMSKTEMDTTLRETFERVVQNQKDSYQLMLAAAGAVMMEEQADLMSGAAFAKKIMSQPEYILRLAADPEAMRKHAETLHKMGRENLDFFMKDLKSKLDAAKTAGPTDAGSQFNFYFGEGSTAAILPDQLADRGKRKQFQERAALALALLKDEIPDAPVSGKRLRRADENIIDVAVDRAQDAEFTNAMESENGGA
jgi:hypothetical protein